MSNKVELERVTKAYGDVVVLNEVDLAVSDHDVVCLIGSSGSGKSTLLKCVDLLLPIDAGRILLDGDDITGEHVNPDEVR
ncbi:MAG: ATP-binding cassette domain-containing protein, partial [Acidimicrobiia bacterium]|nr:ATP-binding cassette domain-containing protein [Acidimicrobiia bacterium]